MEITYNKNQVLALPTVSAYNLKAKLCPTEISSGKTMAALCSTQ